MLNAYFSDCFNRSLPPLNEADVPPEAVLSEADSGIADELLCIEEEVLGLLQKINISKSGGPDKISGRTLKSTALSTVEPVSKLFNLSLSSGVIPAKLKLFSIVPIPKSADKGNPKNYHPTSLLPLLSKLLEKHICGLLSDFLQSSTPIYDSQWGFQRSKSTTTAL